jgi:hypothetical protein
LVLAVDFAAGLTAALLPVLAAVFTAVFLAAGFSADSLPETAFSGAALVVLGFLSAADAAERGFLGGGTVVSLKSSGQIKHIVCSGPILCRLCRILC